MLKRFGLPVIALFALLLMVAPHQANAAVRWGVYVGAPTYAYPAYPAYPYAYADPYAYDPYYYSAPSYYYSPYIRYYRAPSYGFGYSYRGGYRNYDRHEFRGNGRGERDGGRRNFRR